MRKSFRSNLSEVLAKCLTKDIIFPLKMYSIDIKMTEPKLIVKAAIKAMVNKGTIRQHYAKIKLLRELPKTNLQVESENFEKDGSLVIVLAEK